MKKLNSISYYSIAIGAFMTFALFSSYTEENKSTGQSFFSDTHKLPQIIKSVTLDKSFDFAGEVVPLDNFDARERLDKELTVNAYRHSATLINIKKSTRYFPIIEKILGEQGVPEDFKFVSVAESDLSNATSPAGAKGFWQFMTGTARDYGLEVSSTVDERFNLELSTVAACKHIKKLKNQLGSWELAASAYNVGQGKLKSEIETQRATSFYDLNLNEETSRYLFRIVAIKEIMSHPADYGFDVSGESYEPLDNYTVIEVNSSIANLGDFAQKYGTNYRMLKLYNPWLLNSSLENKAGKTYFIKVPKK